MKATMKMGTKVGAAIGVVVFLVFGIIPGFYFGSYGALVLMSHLFGGPVQATVLVRVVTAVGILMGITCVGFMSIVAGAIFGTVVGYLTGAVSAALKEKIPAETAEVKAIK